MSSKKQKHDDIKLSLVIKSMLGFIVGMIYYNRLQFVTSVGYIATGMGVWQYHKSAWFLTMLMSEWEALPEVEPSSFREISAEEFTKERFWEVTDNLRHPVVIRGGLAGSKALNKWNGEFFNDQYPQESVIVRQMIDDSNFRLVNATMAEFWEAFDRGSKVSIVASSGILVREPALLQQVLPEFESEIVDKDGVGVFVNQLFVTPAGRTFYHTEFGGNLFRQISGRKKWSVIAPEYSKYLCPYFIRGSATVKPCVQDFDADLREQWFKRIPRMETILEPGDIIYNAPWFWHDVQAVGTDKQQASVAGRIANKFTSFGIAPALSFGVAIDKWIRYVTEGFQYPDNPKQAVIELENLLVRSWTNTCLKQGRTDCLHLSHDS